MKSVLVTGGGRRLGAAIARACAAAGWTVIVHYRRSREAAETLAAELGGHALAADLADPAPDLVARARKVLKGPLGAVVNSASEFTFDDAARFDPALLARLHAVNLAAPIQLARDLAAQTDLGEGAVVNLLDQKVANLNPDFLSYTLSKTGLATATELLARAFAPRVRVNAVSPGLTLRSGEQDAAQFGAVSAENLLRRPVGADAVADAVVYLLAARSVTGQNLFVDCGQRFMTRDSDVMYKGVARP